MHMSSIEFKLDISWRSLNKPHHSLAQELLSEKASSCFSHMSKLSGKVAWIKANSDTMCIYFHQLGLLCVDLM